MRQDAARELGRHYAARAQALEWDVGLVGLPGAPSTSTTWRAGRSPFDRLLRPSLRPRIRSARRRTFAAGGVRHSPSHREGDAGSGCVPPHRHRQRGVTEDLLQRGSDPPRITYRLAGDDCARSWKWKSSSLAPVTAFSNALRTLPLPPHPCPRGAPGAPPAWCRRPGA